MAAIVYSNTVVTSDQQLVVSNGGASIDAYVTSGGEIVVGSGGYAISTTVFSGGIEVVQNGGTALATHLYTGANLDLSNVAYTSAGTADLNYTTDVLTVKESGETYTFQLDGNYNGEYFHLASDGNGGTLVSLDTNPCYCNGTLIRTRDGDSPIEKLQIGDLVVNYRGELRSIKWIGHRSYDGRFIGKNRDILPICFKAGSISDQIPARDLWVSPHHAFYLAGVLIEAKDLINGTSIVQSDFVESLTYFHIELNEHDVIIAEGALAESFVDDNCRSMFQNVDDYFERYPTNENDEKQRFCAPRVEFGSIIEEVRAALNARAVTHFRASNEFDVKDARKSA